MIKFKVANDNGNSEQDMFFNDNKPVTSPNVLARAYNLPNLDEISTDYVISHIHDNLIVEVEGGVYYIGNLALKSGLHCHSITVGVNNNKITSDIVFVNTLAHIAGEAVSYAANNEPDTLNADIIKVSCDMATAIPVSYYSRANALAFANRFMGKPEHRVIVHAGAKEFVVSVHFDFVKVIPEGVTAAYAFLTNPELFFDGKSGGSPEEVKKSRILHIAIGEGTTEFPITQDIHFRPERNKGTNNGNGRAIARVLPSFKTMFGLQSITRQDFSRYIRDKDHKYHADAMDVFMPALMDEAQDIIEYADQCITEINNEVDVIAVYGGGSILMKDFLKPRLQEYCDRARIRLLYIEDENTAVLLEATGLKEFVNSKLFAGIKEKMQKSIVA